MQAALSGTMLTRAPEPGGRERSAGNPFFESWALRAAIEHLRSGPVEMIPVGGARDPGAVLPLTRLLGGLPGMGSIWSVWDHIHCFDTTPAGADAAAVLDGVFGFLDGRGASLLRWSSLPTDTPFYGELVRYLTGAGLEFQETRTRVRPLLLAGDPQGADCEAAHLRGKRMSETRRRRRRLEEEGRLEVRVHEGPHDAGAWTGDFLDLEASGWKGEQGTAFGCRLDERAFFETLMCDAAAQGKTWVCSLELGGRPVAMTVNLRSGSRVWGFKTAYRDDLARLSPGALVMCETTVRALEEPSIAWLDSCMEHDGGLPGQLWYGRRRIVDLVISTRRSNNWLPGTARFALDAVRRARGRIAPLLERRGTQPDPVRRGESRISRIVAGITSIVVLPEMPTVVLMTASM